MDHAPKRTQRTGGKAVTTPVGDRGGDVGPVHGRGAGSLDWLAAQRPMNDGFGTDAGRIEIHRTVVDEGADQQDATLQRIERLREKVTRGARRESAPPGIEKVVEMWLERLDEQAATARAGDTTSTVESDLDDLEESIDAGLGSPGRRGSGRRTSGRGREYAVSMPFQDPVTEAAAMRWLVRETEPLDDLPGGDVVRRALLDRLDASNDLMMGPSRRSTDKSGLKSTEELRDAVGHGIDSGHYGSGDLEEFDRASEDGGWPSDPQGESWQVDHVLELWMNGGDDELGNLQAIDPRVHRLKTEIMGRFRKKFRDAHRVDGEQSDARQGLPF